MDSRVSLPFRPVLAVLAAAGGFTFGRAQEPDWSDLLAKSPFGQPAGSSATTAPTELEFRGMVVEGNVQLFNLYDPATKTSRWIQSGVSDHGVQVTKYDGHANQVQVSRDGRALTLPLKQARVTLQQAAPPAAKDKDDAEGPEAAAREERRAEFRARMRARMENGEPPLPPEEMTPEMRAARDEVRRRRALRDGNRPAAAGRAAPAANPNSPSS